MVYKGYQQIPQERFEIIHKRYQDFIAALNDPDKEPVRVFDPLNPTQLQALDLIREVSKELKIMKEEDLKKAAQAKIEEAEAAKKKAEEEKAAKKEEHETPETPDEPKKEE